MYSEEVKSKRRVGRTYEQAKRQLLMQDISVPVRRVFTTRGADGVGVVYVDMRATGQGRACVVSMEYDVDDAK